MLTLGLGFVFSRFGFATIVEIFYPIEGIFGGVFILYSMEYYFKNRNSSPLAKKTKKQKKINNMPHLKKRKHLKQLKSISVSKVGDEVEIKKEYF